MKVLIDTNIVLDFMLNRENFSNDANYILGLCGMNLVEGYLTSKSFADLFYIMHHYLNNTEKTKTQISKWISIVRILDTTGYDCINALKSDVTDYEDAIMVETAKRERIDYIITRNIKDFEKSELKAILPSQFIELFLK